MALLEDRPRLLQYLHGAYCEVQLRGLCEDRTAVRNTFKMVLGIVRIQEKIKNGNKWEFLEKATSMIMNLFGFVQSVKRFGLLVQFIRLESNVGNIPVSPFPPQKIFQIPIPMFACASTIEWDWA